MKKAPKKLNLLKWKGHCAESFARLGYSSVDKFIADVRGRVGQDDILRGIVNPAIK